MMIQNAAFIPDAVPTAAMQGRGTAAPGPGGGSFEQLMQGRQPGGPVTDDSVTEPAGRQKEEQPRLQDTDGVDGATVGSASERNGLAAEAGQSATKAGAKAVVAKLQQVTAWEAVQSGLAGAEQAAAAELAGQAAGKDDAAKAVGGMPEQEPGADTAAVNVAAPSATLSEVVQAAVAGAAMVAPEAMPAVTGKGDTPPGLAVAAGAVQANMEQRSGTEQAEAGAQALLRLRALQEAAMAHEQPAGNGTGLKLGQEAESARVALQDQGRQAVNPSSATEGARVEVPGFGGAEQMADGWKASQPGAGASTATAATGRQEGFIPMPVPGTGNETAGQPVAAAGASEGAQVEAQNSNARAKAEGQLAAASQEQQAAEELAKAGGKSQERRDLRLGEGLKLSGKETVPAPEAGVATAASGEVSGSTTQSAVPASLVPEQGTGRDTSGGAGRQGHPEQKGQEPHTVALSGMTPGAQGSSALEAGQPEAREAGSKSALHQSILSQVKEGVVSHDGKGNGQMSIRLNPGELGELKIQVRMEDNRLKVEVQADNRAVKDLLMSNLDSLKEALTSKNFTMDGFNVSTGGGFNAPLHEERGNPRQQSQPRFARGAGYDGQEVAQVNYLTGEVNNLLDVRF